MDDLRPVAAAAQRSDEVNGRAGRVQIWGHVKLSPQNSAVELELRDRVVGSGFTQQALPCGAMASESHPIKWFGLILFKKKLKKDYANKLNCQEIVMLILLKFHFLA